jgi:hypothetical protein
LQTFEDKSVNRQLKNLEAGEMYSEKTLRELVGKVSFAKNEYAKTLLTLIMPTAEYLDMPNITKKYINSLDTVEIIEYLMAVSPVFRREFLVKRKMPKWEINTFMFYALNEGRNALKSTLRFKTEVNEREIEKLLSKIHKDTAVME